MANEEKTARLAAARATVAALAAAEQEAADDRELAILELEISLTAKHGPRGNQYEIVDGGHEGPVAVKLGDLVVYKRFQSAVTDEKGKGLTPELAFEYVFPCLAFPDADSFKAIYQRRPGLVFRCATALSQLFAGKESSDREK